MSPATRVRPEHWREVIAASVAKAVFTAILVVYLVSSSLLGNERSKW
jgi:hypothetical protein